MQTALPALERARHSNRELAAPTQVFKRPLPTELSRSEILAHAGRTAARLGLAPGAEVEPVVRHLGGRVLGVLRSDPTFGGANRHATLRVHAVGSFDIFIPDDLGWYRRRYLLAHELGHYMLHFPLVHPSPMEANYIDATRAEWEADTFASGLLVPPESLTIECERHRHIIVDVAAAFGVGAELIRERLREV